MDAMKEWLGLIALVVSLGGTAYAWLTAGSKTTAKDLSAFKKEVGEKLDDHGSRIQAVESDIRHMPDKDAVTDLKLALSELRGAVGILGETVGSVQRTVLRIDDFLKQDKK